MSENTDQSAENPRQTLIEQIAQALGIVDDEHERRQAPNVNDDYTNEMMWVSDTLVAARDEIKRLRDLVDFAIAAIDSNQCYMGEEDQADLLNHLRLSRDSERTEWSENED